MNMTEQELRAAMERADAIVEKVRNLVALEDKVLEAREATLQLSTNGNTADGQNELVETSMVYDHKDVCSIAGLVINRRLVNGQC